MKVLSRNLSVALCLLLFSTIASSEVIFDFQDLTDRNTQKISGVLPDGSMYNLANPFEMAFESFRWEQDGLILDVSANYQKNGKYKDSYLGAYSKGDPLRSWAYLDSGNAGLGVCSFGLKTDSKGQFQCNPGNDDNITDGEWLNLDFSERVALSFSDAFFRDKDHRPFDFSKNSIDVSTDGGVNWSSVNPNTTVMGDSYVFRTGDKKSQFYLDTLTALVVDSTGNISDVSLSSLGALSGALMIGMGWLGFRRRK